jgi:DNA polymerase III subunit delta
VLAERVEGNLAAAVQEIEKLRVSGLPSPIGAEALLAVLEDASHFDTFELVDAVFAGDAARVSRMVTSLREEDVSPFAVFGALASQLRMLADGGRCSGPEGSSRRGSCRRIGGRDAPSACWPRCALVDAQGKGQIPGDAWWSLEDLLLRLCGVRVLPGSVPLLRRAL